MARSVEFDPGLVEESVLLAVETSPPGERRAFRRERDILYEVEDLGQREARFGALHGRWFVRLGLSETLHRLLAEQPGLTGEAALVSRCLVLPAVAASDEGADLHASPSREGAPGAGLPVLVIRLRPASLLDRRGLAALLRHELAHVADMLDPQFAYARELPSGDAGPSRESLIRDRYRAVWNASVDGRLAARGLLATPGEQARRREFHAAFPMLDAADAERQFQRFFTGPRPRHDEICGFAADPGGGQPAAERAGVRTGRCPLCRFPTRSFHPDPQELDEEVVSLIQRDFPRWRPAQGLCPQCADLYASRISLHTPG